MSNFLNIIIDDPNLKHSEGMKAMKLSDLYFIWMWCGNKVLVYEIKSLDLGLPRDRERELLDEFSLQFENPNKNEFNLGSNVVDIFHLYGDCVYAMDSKGVLYSFQFLKHTSSPRQFMETEDLFSSPTSSSELSSNWKESTVIKINNCEQVISVCHFSTGMAVLTTQNKYLALFIYSFPEFDLKCIKDLQTYTSQESVMSSCDIASLAPSLKQHFQENLETFDTHIIIIAMLSGLVLWFSVKPAVKGPFVLFSTNENVLGIHWIKDTVTEHYTQLLMVLGSGQIVVFGQQSSLQNLYLPESVKATYCLKNYVITSNFIDCYTSELQLNEKMTLNCASLPIKGICTMTGLPGSDILLLATSIHGSVYCFDPTVTPTENPSQFALPDHSLIDNMFFQTQELEIINKQLDEEDSILKAMAAATVANSNPNLFQLSIILISDSEFVITAQLIEGGIIFCQQFWQGCLEIVDRKGKRETSFYKLKQDFNRDNELALNVNHKLSIGSVITFQLVSFIQTQQPLLISSFQKIEIDACHLMASQVVAPNILSNEESLEKILLKLNGQVSEETLKECKLVIKLSDNYIIKSLLPNILQDSQCRISGDDWTKISGGKKYSIQLSIHGKAVMLNLEVESRELILTCCDIQLCHQLKRAILKRIIKPEEKYISENLAQDIQALHKIFELERMKDVPDLQSLELLRRKLRSTVSSQLPT